MATKGILALLGARPEDDSDEEDSEELGPKARAVRDLFEAAREEDWEAAAEAFGRAYDICRMKSEKGSKSPDESGSEGYQE